MFVRLDWGVMLNPVSLRIVLTNVVPPDISVGVSSSMVGGTQWVKILFRGKIGKPGVLDLRLDFEDLVAWGVWMDLGDLTNLGIAKAIVPDLLRELRLAGLESIRLRANYLGGYVWARMGGVPLLGEMGRLVADVLVAAGDDEGLRAAARVLNVDCPGSVKELAELPEGKQLLENTFWEIQMDLNDQQMWQSLLAYCAQHK